MKHDSDDDHDFRTDGLGVLGGDGSLFLEKVTSSVKPEGIASTCSCEYCGNQCVLVVGYEEATIGSLKLMPPNWKYDPKLGIYPNIGCKGCGHLLRLHFQPEELKRHIQNAINQGVLPPQQVQGWVAKYSPMAPR